jgi:hypothetical protein
LSRSGVSLPHARRSYSGPELIGTVKRNRVTKSLATGCADRCCEIRLSPVIERRGVSTSDKLVALSENDRATTQTCDAAVTGMPAK